MLLSKGVWYTFSASMGLIAGNRSQRALDHPWLRKLRWLLPLLGAQLCVLPLNLMFQGTSRPLSIFWNSFGLIFLGILFLLFLLSLISMFWQSFAIVPNYWENNVATLLNGLEQTADFGVFYRFPGHPLMVCIFIAALLTCLLYASREWRWYASIGIIVLLLMFNRPLSGESITMIDTGQGQCILLTWENGDGVLLDAGGKLPYGIDLITICRLNGAKNLEAVFISHANSDHYSLVPELPEELPIYVPLNQGKVMTGIDELQGINIRELKAGDQLLFGEWNATVLWPNRESLTGSLNDTGLVLLFSNGKASILFTGDAGFDVERKIDLPLSVPKPLILQVGHHGSKNSCSNSLLKLLSPEVALISAGRENPFNHPNPMTLKRLNLQGIPFLCTADGGSIRVELNRDRSLKFEFLKE